MIGFGISPDFFLFGHPDLDMLLLPGKNEETHPLKNREHPKYFRNVYGVMYHVPILRSKD